jgi:hypothetical protein
VLDRAEVGMIGQKKWTNLGLLGAASIRHSVGVTLFGNDFQLCSQNGVLVSRQISFFSFIIYNTPLSILYFKQ